VVFYGMQSMSVRNFRVMRSLFMIAGFVMLGRFAMVLCRVVVVLRGMLVMLMNFVTAHVCSPELVGS
jgi:hypothetical protein